MEKNRIEQQLDFIAEIDKMKSIYRQTYIADASRPENDTEHSWHLALMAMLLSEYSNEKVDISRVIQMVLIHDMVEIDAGDTYAYDPEANKTKREREVKAADRIFNILPEEQAKWMRELWDEYEDAETREAKFALSLDIFHPILMNDLGEGKAWVDHDVDETPVRERIERMRPGSETLFQLANAIVDKNLEKGTIIPSNQ